jgi:aconitase A
MISTNMPPIPEHQLIRLPFSIKILVENLLRKIDGRIVKEA